MRVSAGDVFRIGNAVIKIETIELQNSNRMKSSPESYRLFGSNYDFVDSPRGSVVGKSLATTAIKPSSNSSNNVEVYAPSMKEAKGDSQLKRKKKLRFDASVDSDVVASVSYSSNRIHSILM